MSTRQVAFDLMDEELRALAALAAQSVGSKQDALVGPGVFPDDYDPRRALAPLCSEDPFVTLMRGVAIGAASVTDGGSATNAVILGEAIVAAVRFAARHAAERDDVWPRNHQ
jgi:hypothetical protein